MNSQICVCAFLCSMEDRAGDQCREAIEKALTYHPDNPEALQLMASYLFSTEKNQVSTHTQYDYKSEAGMSHAKLSSC